MAVFSDHHLVEDTGPAGCCQASHRQRALHDRNVLVGVWEEISQAAAGQQTGDCAGGQGELGTQEVEKAYSAKPPLLLIQ